MMKFKKTTVALATAGAMVAFVPNMAHALALATSTLEMTSFSLYHSNGTIYDTGDFSLIVPASSASISATYNGVAGTNVNGVTAGGPLASGQIDLFPVCSGPGCAQNGSLVHGVNSNGVLDNAFPKLSNPGSPVGSNFVAADQQESGSPITGIVAGNAPATVKSGSYASLTSNSAGPNNAEANNQLTGTWLFTVAQADSIKLAFDAAIYQESFLDPTMVFPASAQTTSQFFFKITNQDTGALVFDWSPNGIAGDGIGVLAEVDPFSLNGGTSRSSPFNGTSRLPGEVAGTPLSGSFSGTTAVLAAGTTYRLDATLKTTATAIESNGVPEPGSMALLGLGLAGLGLISRRRRDPA